MSVHGAIGQARQGDSDAVHYLYAVYADDLYAFIQSIVSDPHDAEDVCQTVFARLPVILDRYEEREAAFAAWLFRVARNAALDHVRGRRQVPVEEVRANAVSDPLSDLERSVALREALDELSEDQRQVVLMRHLLGMSPGEIAERTGRSEGSVHGLHHRGRQALQAHLRGSGVLPATPDRLAG
jgi:RNA polymerase sigma-70 factor (ECF subfamily)